MLKKLWKKVSLYELLFQWLLHGLIFWNYLRSDKSFILTAIFIKRPNEIINIANKYDSRCLPYAKLI